MKEVRLNQEITFTVKGMEYQYVVFNTHLHRTGGGSNNIIFSRLGIDNRKNFATSIYGYTASDGDWPSYMKEDFKAATRLVEELQLLCDKPTILETHYLEPIIS